MRDRRLYLFDIDGTLIVTGGAGSGAMRLAFNALWRDTRGFEGIEFSGRTDRALLREALISSNLDDGDFEPKLRRFKRAYFSRLPMTLRATEGRVLQGVPELLERLSKDSGATLALGTGNFRHSAGVKLAHYGVAHYFRTGGFGDRTEDRASLIAHGIRSAERSAGRHASIFVIGDTVHDIAAAKANNVIAVGVATGSASESTLAAAGADMVLPNLLDASAILTRRD